MNFLLTKWIFSLVLMIAFLMIAVLSNDVVDRQLFASLGIVMGAFTTKFISNQTQVKNEEY
jgi:4-hydroxybenzoate polyprenyltransferase